MIMTGRKFLKRVTDSQATYQCETTQRAIALTNLSPLVPRSKRVYSKMAIHFPHVVRVCLLMLIHTSTSCRAFQIMTHFGTQSEQEPARMQEWPTFGIPTLVPRPRSLILHGGNFVPQLGKISMVMVRDTTDDSVHDLVRRFTENANRVLEANTKQHEEVLTCELVFLEHAQPLPKPHMVDEHGAIAGREAYEIQLWGNRTLRITASTFAGLVHATTTSLQLLKALATHPLPALRIVDAPVSSYRGIMIDNVRAPHSFAFHMGMLDEIAMNKLNVYHIHASDDQGYSMPSVAFPNLPMTSALTMAQAKELSAKATSLAIEVVAEVDLPGHSAALLAKIPSLRAINTATGKPCNTINVSSPTALATMQTLLTELMDLFPGRFHHLGADEVEFNEACGMTKATYHDFINTMGTFVHSKNRTMIVWEGFDPAPGDTAAPIDKSVVVSPFDSIRLLSWPHRPHNYYDQGYNLINTDWNPLYLVHGGSGFAAGPEALASWNPTKYGNYPTLGASSDNWQSLPQDNWNSPTYHSSFTGENASCWPERSQHSSSYIPSPYPANRLLGGALCSWGNPENAEVYMFFGTCGEKMPAELPGPGWPRPAPRGPIVAERLWSGAIATSQDLLERVNCSYWAQPAPAPPSPPPVPNSKFTPQSGACRSADGSYSNRLDHEGSLNFSTCQDQCTKLGERCDAFDIDGPVPQPGTDPLIGWCGVWGQFLTAADEDLDAGFKFYESNGGRVCQGLVKAGASNNCYHCPPLCTNSTQA
eukprot:m.54163 g.54163  ORF g.54163 m.54163 type:complete len:761 (+) comp21873_c0_seq2:37-2319(+)